MQNICITCGKMFFHCAYDKAKERREKERLKSNGQQSFSLPIR